MSRPRTVLLVAHSLGGGGSERVTVNIANHLGRCGWNVVLVPLVHSLADYDVSESVEVSLDLPQGGPRLVRGLRKLLGVAHLLRSVRPDVVVSLGAGYGYLVCASLLGRSRLVTSLRNDPSALFSGHPFRRLLYALTFGLSTRVVFQTRNAAEYFGKHVQAKSVIVDNPLREGLPRNDDALGMRTHEIVSFGRFMPQKRLDVLLRAFAQVAERLPNYRLAIFGRGPVKNAMIDLAVELGISDRVTIEDFRPDVHERIRNSAMYVSTSDFEGVSNSMLEAMAIGLPAVCTDCPPGGAREVIERFGTGVLVPVGDHTRVAEAMVSVLSSDVRGDEMIVNGRLLRRELASDVVCDQWRLLLDAVVG